MKNYKQKLIILFLQFLSMGMVAQQTDSIEWEKIDIVVPNFKIIIDKDTSHSGVWDNIDITSPDFKEPPGWFKWWYIPIALTPTALIPILSKEEESPLPPTLNCGEDVIGLSWGTPLPTPNTGSVSVTDNCQKGSVTIIHVGDVSNGGTGCAGDPLTWTRTYKVTDGCGNTATCTQLFSYSVDITSPVLSGVPNDEVVECDAIPEPSSVTASDDCDPSPNIDFTETIGTGIPYTITRVWSAMDICGNTTTQTQIITVDDTQAPTLNGVPQDVTVECNNIPGLPNITATDNCTTNPSISFEETIGTGIPYTITRTWTAEDEAGNTTTQTQVITVQDTEAPELIGVPNDVTVECNNIPTLPNISAIDNCTANLTISFEEVISTGNPYTITRSWTVEDEAGNATSQSQVITVQDTQVPTIVIQPIDITVECDGLGNQNELTTWLNNAGGAQAMDLCSDIIWNNDFVNLTNDCGMSGNAIVTFTVTDEAGNSSSVTATFTIIDSSAPIISCPADIILICGDAFDPSVTGLPIVDENCGNFSITFTDDDPGNCPAIINRTFTVIDDCGNETNCTQAITFVNSGCTFNVSVDAIDATCSNNNGSGSVNIGDPGIFEVFWSNGSTGTEVQNLAPGTYTITVVETNINCSEVLNIFIDEIPLPLEVQGITEPSNTSAADGSITLLINEPLAVAPFDIIVNGIPFGSTNDLLFTLNNLTSGIYEIQIIAMNGCVSNLVTVVLSASLKPPLNYPENIDIVTSINISSPTDISKVLENNFSINDILEEAIIKGVEHPIIEKPVKFSFPYYPKLGVILSKKITNFFQLELSFLGQKGVAKTFNQLGNLASDKSFPFQAQSDFTAFTTSFSGNFNPFFRKMNSIIFLGTGIQHQYLSVEKSQLNIDLSNGDKITMWKENAYIDQNWVTFLNTGYKQNLSKLVFLKLDARLFYDIQKGKGLVFSFPPMISASIGFSINRK